MKWSKILCFFGIHKFEGGVENTYDQPTKKYTYHYYNECDRCKRRATVAEVKKDKYHRYQPMGTPLNTTAINCVVCGKKLDRSKGQRVLFCCKEHRKLYRGGSANRKRYGDLRTFIDKQKEENAKKAQDKQKNKEQQGARPASGDHKREDEGKKEVGAVR